MLRRNISDITIINVKGAYYHCIIYNISNSDAIYFSGNFVLKMILIIYRMNTNQIGIKNGTYNYYFDKSIKSKKLETKNTLIEKKQKKTIRIW